MGLAEVAVAEVWAARPAAPAMTWGGFPSLVDRATVFYLISGNGAISPGSTLQHPLLAVKLATPSPTVVAIRCLCTRHTTRPTDHLLAKPDRPESSPAKTGVGAGQGRIDVVRGCPLGTGRNCSEWHGTGTADQDNGVQPGALGPSLTCR
jgi:hypothetical protein